MSSGFQSQYTASWEQHKVEIKSLHNLVKMSGFCDVENENKDTSIIYNMNNNIEKQIGIVNGGKFKKNLVA